MIVQEQDLATLKAVNATMAATYLDLSSNYSRKAAIFQGTAVATKSFVDNTHPMVAVAS